MPRAKPPSSYTCPACSREYRLLRDAIACWLRAEPDAVSTRSLRRIAEFFSCSAEAIRLACNALGVDTALPSKLPGFRRNARLGPRIRERTEADRQRDRMRWQALKADPTRYAVDLERRRRRNRDRWRTDPDFRRRRLEAMRRWQEKRKQRLRGEQVSQAGG